jgi:tRNA pseudouridine38-40 synthase
MRFCISLAYNGTRYNGWQIQPNAVSVQETIEKELSKVLQEQISLVGAGRTDTGVHASCYFAHFDINQQFDTKDIVYKLNKMLPPDIVINSIHEVSNEYHARFGAKSRTYIYTLTTVKNPFTIETAWLYPYKIDLELMNKAAAVLMNYMDFTSFSKLHTDVANNNCTITSAKWEQVGNTITFTITANRFLRNMVRSITGTLLDVGQGKITIEDFEKIIESKNRQNAGQSIPAHGLCLVDISY